MDNLDGCRTLIANIHKYLHYDRENYSEINPDFVRFVCEDTVEPPNLINVVREPHIAEQEHS
jgi:hypothetical protein